jgi:hypothetical protein
MQLAQNAEMVKIKFDQKVKTSPFCRILLKMDLVILECCLPAPTVARFRTAARFNSCSVLQQPPRASTAAACFNSRSVLQHPQLASTAAAC